MSDLQPLLQQVIERWRAENIPIPPGVDEGKIAMFESRYGITLPSDNREYYLTVNGTGQDYDDDFYRFWPLEEVKPAESYDPELATILPASVGYFLFVDCAVDMYWFGFRPSDSEATAAQLARIYPRTSDDAAHFDQLDESFSELLAMCVSHNLI